MKKSILSLLVLGTGVTSLSGCWLGTGAALGGEGVYVATQEDRTAGETLDDQVLLTKIKSKLLADPDVSGFAIDVDVTKGDVQLRGYVKTNREIDRAIELARSTKGVRSVESKLVLDRG
jgi:hyperosmotically inducible protein